MMTRAEHIAWAKERALEYLPEHPDQAVASFVSDLGKHDETAGTAIRIGLQLTDALLRRREFAGRRSKRTGRDDIADLRRAIEAVR